MFPTTGSTMMAAMERGSSHSTMVRIVRAQNDGSVVTWSPFNRSTSFLTVVEGEPVMAAAPAAR